MPQAKIHPLENFNNEEKSKLEAYLRKHRIMELFEVGCSGCDFPDKQIHKNLFLILFIFLLSQYLT